jgi:hypothetical protein
VGKDSDSILPEKLEDLWDDELSGLYAQLLFPHQTFALEVLEHGRQADAYRKAYKNAPETSVYASASALMRHPKVRAFITAYREKNAHRHEDDKELIRSSLREAITKAETPVFGKDAAGQPDHVMDLPDWKARIKACEALAKLDGHNAAETVNVNPSDEFRKLWAMAKGPA